MDEYQYGTVDRLSPEAPVPVFVPRASEVKAGMAANVEENLKALGGVTVLSWLGPAGSKTRLIDVRSKQHLMRVDRDIACTEPLTPDVVAAALASQTFDGIIVSDYDKGFVTYELIEWLIGTGLPVFIDTKKTDLALFEGACVKINSAEFAAAKTLTSNLVVTCGDKGAYWNGETFPAPSVGIADVCGAGDTFLAALAHAYLNTRDMRESIQFAIKAAAVTVQHVGVYAPKMEEIV